MSETQQSAADNADTAAEKAYAAAAEAVSTKPAEPVAAEVTETPVAAVELAEPAAAIAPAKAKPSAAKKPATAKSPRQGAPKIAEAPIAEAAPKLRKTAAKPKLAVKRTPVAKRPAAKTVVAKPVAPKIAAPKVAAKPAPKKIASSARPTAVTPAALPIISTASQLKDKTMDMSTKFTEGFKTVASDAQEKAKEIYTKGSAIFGEAGEFTKGNVQAVVASGKILASGLKDMSDTLVADTKETIETISSDVKQVASVKSPTELVKLQSDLMQRNLDKAVAYNSKATEAMIKLTNEMMAPVSARFTLAIEKVRAFA